MKKIIKLALITIISLSILTACSLFEGKEQTKIFELTNDNVTQRVEYTYKKDTVTKSKHSFIFTVQGELQKDIASQILNNIAKQYENKDGITMTNNTNGNNLEMIVDIDYSKVKDNDTSKLNIKNIEEKSLKDGFKEIKKETN